MAKTFQEQMDELKLERERLKLEQDREAFNQKRAREQAKTDADRARSGQATFLGAIKTISSAVDIGRKTAQPFFPAAKVTGSPAGKIGAAFPASRVTGKGRR